MHNFIKVYNDIHIFIQQKDNAEYLVKTERLSRMLPNEQRRQKTGLRGFRPAPTQTGLYSPMQKRLET